MTFTQERIRGGNYVPVVTVNGKRHVLHAKGFPTRTAWTEGTADGVLKPAEVARIKTQGAEAIEAIQAAIVSAESQVVTQDARVEM